jgi:hypothetical protein
MVINVNSVYKTKETYSRHFRVDVQTIYTKVRTSTRSRPQRIQAGTQHLLPDNLPQLDQPSSSGYVYFLNFQSLILLQRIDVALMAVVNASLDLLPLNRR